MLFYQRSIDITVHRCKQSTQTRFSAVRFAVELLDWIIMKFYSTTRLLSFMKTSLHLIISKNNDFRSNSGLKSFHVRCQRRLQLEWENGSVREKYSLRISSLAQKIFVLRDIRRSVRFWNHGDACRRVGRKWNIRNTGLRTENACWMDSIERTVFIQNHREFQESP